MVIKRLFLAFAMCAMVSLTSHAQMLAINTDLAWDGAGAPNLGLEMVTGNRSTVGVSAIYANNPWGMDAKCVLVQPELRYYFSGRPMHSYFVGISGVGGTYNFTYKDKVRDGFGAGGGITFGYVWNFTKRWSLDFHTGFGCIYYKQKEHDLGDKYDDGYSVDGNIKSNSHGYSLLPTKIGISLSYILK